MYKCLIHLFKTMSSDSAPDSARHRLLEAAEHIVVDRGWRAATSRAIAAEAGLNPGLVNYYFGSKDDLLVEAYERSFARFEEPFAQALAAGSLAEAMHGVAQMVESPELARESKMLFEASLQALVDDRLRALSVQKLRSFRAVMTDKLKQEGRTKKAAAALSTVIAAAFDGLLLHRLLDEETDVPAGIDELASLLD